MLSYSRRKITEPEILCSSVVPADIFVVGWALHFTGSIASKTSHTNSILESTPDAQSAIERLRYFDTSALPLARIATLHRRTETDVSNVVFVLPFFAIYRLQMRRSMMIGVYGVLSIGAVDIAFSLTRFLIIQTTAVDDFRSITTIGKPPTSTAIALTKYCSRTLVRPRHDGRTHRNLSPLITPLLPPKLQVLDGQQHTTISHQQHHRRWKYYREPQGNNNPHIGAVARARSIRRTRRGGSEYKYCRGRRPHRRDRERCTGRWWESWRER
jgi:hypothetical protein